MKPNTRTAAPDAGRGAAPEIFNAALARLIALTDETIKACEMTPEMEAAERRRLAMLKLAAASKMPFPDFREELYYVSRGMESQFSDQLDTLSVFYDICFTPEPERPRA